MSLHDSKRVRQNIHGAPFRIGDAVRVVMSADETFDKQYLGEVGTVLYFDYSCGCGQSFPEDPMIGVQFTGFRMEEFWKEELTIDRGT